MSKSSVARNLHKQCEITYSHALRFVHANGDELRKMKLDAPTLTNAQCALLLWQKNAKPKKEQ